MQRPVGAILSSLRGHEESAGTMCRLHAAGNQLQIVEQRRAAVREAEQRPRRSLASHKVTHLRLTLDRNYAIHLNHCCRQARQTDTL